MKGYRVECPCGHLTAAHARLADAQAEHEHVHVPRCPIKTHTLSGRMPDWAMHDDWERDALCREVDPDLFFPEKGEPSTQAKRICAQCPVRRQCLDKALERGERHGIWGGESERARRAMEHRARVVAGDRTVPGEVDMGKVRRIADEGRRAGERMNRAECEALYLLLLSRGLSGRDMERRYNLRPERYKHLRPERRAA